MATFGISGLSNIEDYRKARGPGRIMPDTRPSPYTQSRPTPDTRPSPTASNKLGDLNYDTDKYADWNEYSLPTVNDPEQTFADIMLGEQRDYMKDFAAFEESLVAARDDTSLIDAVPEDVAMQAQKAREIAERNKRRFGVTSTAVEEREAERSLQRGETLGLAGGLTNARIAQKEQNSY